MREIKFRAWDNYNKRMGHFEPGFSWLDEYDLWHLSQVQEEHNKRITDVPCEENIILMQYTGLFDKNRKEICEGDVVKCYDHPTGVEDVTGVVRYHQGRFVVADNKYSLFDYGTAWTEILGNEHENPELLVTK